MTGTGAIVPRKVHFPGWYGDSLLRSFPALAACVREACLAENEKAPDICAERWIS